MKQIDSLVPWRVENISLRPFKGFFSFNPSIHFDGSVWRCVMRNCDYHAKGGNYSVRNGRIITRNVMVTLDPVTLQPISHTEMRELDGLDRYPSSHYGYEDMRLFRIGSKILGIATTAQLRKEAEQEIVICHFDDEYNIVMVEPIRGPWSKIAQKNWSPYDGLSLPVFLYSIQRGLLLRSGDNLQDPESGGYVRDIITPLDIIGAAPMVHPRGGTETRILGGSRRVIGFDWTTGGLRGGTQLVRLGDSWIAMGHDMRMINGSKYYWHQWYRVDDKGKLLSVSDTFKLTDMGIEFAAGLAIDGDRLVVSYGTEDQDSWLGVTKTSSVMELLCKPC